MDTSVCHGIAINSAEETTEGLIKYFTGKQLKNYD